MVTFFLIFLAELKQKVFKGYVSGNMPSISVESIHPMLEETYERVESGKSV